MYKRFVLTCCTAIVLLAASNAQAYYYKTCLGEKLKWDSDRIPLRVNTRAVPAESSWFTAVSTAVTRFNLNPGNVTYALSEETGSVGLDNGQSEVWISDDYDLVTGSAITATHYSCYWFFGNHVRINEIDIVFRDRPNREDWPGGWSTVETKNTLKDYGGGGLSVPMVAIHEMGHGIGLQHDTTRYNTMGQGQQHLHTNGSVARAYFGEDASVGAVFLYGARLPVRRDVGVVHWAFQQRPFSNNGYHRKTQLLQADGYSVLPGFSDGGEKRYSVLQGQTVAAEFTYENNGASDEGAVSVGFYVSTNDVVSTGDVRIGGTTMNLSPNEVYTHEHELTIPNWLPPGTYWLGPVVDERREIPETAEWNNATYIPIQVCSPYRVCGAWIPPVILSGSSIIMK